MVEEFKSQHDLLTNKGLKIIANLKKEVAEAQENVKKAERELAEVPKEDASENAQLQTARENQARANHVLFMLQKRLQAFEDCIVGYTYHGEITLGSTVQLEVLKIDGKEPEPKLFKEKDTMSDVESSEGNKETSSKEAARTNKYIIKLVNHDASDASNGFVSIDSLVGRALLGKVAGEIVSVTAPRGVIQYKIERMY